MWSVPWFDCDESLTWRGLNSNLVYFCFVFLLSLFHSENHVYLSHGVQVAGAAWHVATRTVTRVGDLVQRTGDGRTGQVLSGRAVERSGGAVCVCTWHVETRSVGFMVEPQNQGRRFVSGLASKPLGWFFPV
jgi:hypothetical protein